MPSATSAGRGGAPLEGALRAILRRFRSQRPLRGGSLILTIFGDCVAPRGGVVSLGSLIRLAGAFGITERLVRTSVGRLAQDGWLVARRDGRLSEYRLTAHGQERFAEATRRIYGANPVSWERRWTLVLLPARPVRRREQLREELRWLGFGQIRPGVFAHPNTLAGQAQSWLDGLASGNSCVVLEGAAQDSRSDREIVAAGWDFGELSRRYRRFVDGFAPVESAVKQRRASLDARSAFIVRTLLIHEYRKIHLQDPLLPPALLPADWVGSRAYELCAGLYADVFPAAEQFLSDTASTLARSLPEASAAVYERFGGISK